MALRTNHQSGRTRIALVTAIALLSQPLTPVMGQTAPSQATAQKPRRRPRPQRRPDDDLLTRGRAAPLTADGRAPIPRTAARHSCCTSRRSPSGRTRSNDRLRRGVLHAQGRLQSGARDAPDRGDTSVSVAERLVDFSKYRILEANFQTLPKEQLQTLTAEVTRPCRPRSGHRARSRPGRRRQEPDHP